MSTVVQRFARRRDQRGAIMFVIAMTLTLLGALGVYAMSGAASEIRTSGYSRQAAQSQYVTEFGAVAMLETFSPQNASYFDAQMMLAPTAATATCRSALPPGAQNSSEVAQRCAKVPQAFFARTLTPGGGEGEGDQAKLFRDDSLSPSGQSRFSASFENEITEPITGGFQPGFDVNNGKCFRRYTITTYGQLKNASETLILSRTAGRARVTAGPFDCGG